MPTAAALRFFRAAYYAPDGYGLPFPGRGLLAGRHSRSSSPRSASFAIWSGIAVLPCFSASVERRRRSLWSPFTGHLCRILAVLPLRLSHAPSAVFSGHCHFHVSHDKRSHSVRALPGLWHGQLGIEPTTHGFGDRVATLVHLPVYVPSGSHR